jgi:hypothetical protein
VIALLIGATIGCASLEPRFSDSALEAVVKGPMHVFTSIDDAAADALAWCYLLSRRDRVQRRDAVRAGVISPVEGGYTYNGIVTAHRLQPSTVSMALAPSDVAHFRLYPTSNDLKIDRMNSTHSRPDRQVVDELDPLHRSSYLMTPNSIVRVYAGGGEEWALGSIGDWAQKTSRWGKRPRVTVEDVARGAEG